MAKVHSLGSAAMTADRADLDAAIVEGNRLEDLEFVVNQVDVVERVPRAATSLADTKELTARVTVRREPLTLLSAKGTQRSVAARTDVVTVRLKREQDGWRFVSWN